jgi:hypothetical protein
VSEWPFDDYLDAVGAWRQQTDVSGSTKLDSLGIDSLAVLEFMIAHEDRCSTLALHDYGPVETVLDLYCAMMGASPERTA